MPITAECSECGRQFEANDAWAGKHFRCPNCGATAAVPIPPGYEHLADPAIPLPPPSYPVRAAEPATARGRLLGEFADRSIPAPEKPTRTGVSAWVLAGVAASLLLCSGLVVLAIVNLPRLRHAETNSISPKRRSCKPARAGWARPYTLKPFLAPTTSPPWPLPCIGRSPGFASWRPSRTAVEQGLGPVSAVFSHFRPLTSDLPPRRL